jgi:DNA recombination protein RmuC
MNLTADTMIIAGLALFVFVFLALPVSLWRNRRAGRTTRDLREQLGKREQELSELGQQHQQLVDRAHRNELQLREELARYEVREEERASRHEEQLSLLKEAEDNMKREFENLANKIFEDKGKSFTTTSQDSLEKLLRPFRDQISGFQTRINEVHTESVKGQATLKSEIENVLKVGLEMNTQATNLTSALKGDKKTTGNWGEAQLQRTLELAGLQAGEHYEAQTSFRDDDGKRKLPDFVIRLPEGKNIVIDSKVSLVDYDRAIAAETEEQRTEALNAHAQAVRNHIEDLSSKDYANLPEIGSPDFVLMFMPFNYGYQKGVVMVSHTTLMPILRTVANLWMIDKSSREAREISNRAGEIYNQVCTVAERLNRLGKTMSAAQNQYNDTVTGLVGKQGLHGKVERFKQISTKANKDMPVLEPLHADIENERLDSVLDNGMEDKKLPPAKTKLKPVKND